MTLEQALELEKGDRLRWTSEARGCITFAKEIEREGDVVEFDSFYEGKPSKHERGTILKSGKIVAAAGDGLPLIYYKGNTGIHFIASSWFELVENASGQNSKELNANTLVSIERVDGKLLDVSDVKKFLDDLHIDSTFRISYKSDRGVKNKIAVYKGIAHGKNRFKVNFGLYNEIVIMSTIFALENLTIEEVVQKANQCDANGPA